MDLEKEILVELHGKRFDKTLPIPVRSSMYQFIEHYNIRKLNDKEDPVWITSDALYKIYVEFTWARKFNHILNINHFAMELNAIGIKSYVKTIRYETKRRFKINVDNTLP